MTDAAQEFECDCSDYGGEYFDFSHETRRISPGGIRCVECGEEIPAGQTYQQIIGRYEEWEGEYHTCLTCVAIRRHYCPWGYLIGGLRVAIEECLGMDYITGEVEPWLDEEDEDDAE